MTAVRGNHIKQLFCAFFVQPDERRRSTNGISYVIPMAANCACRSEWNRARVSFAATMIESWLQTASSTLPGIAM